MEIPNHIAAKSRKHVVNHVRMMRVLDGVIAMNYLLNEWCGMQ